MRAVSNIYICSNKKHMLKLCNQNCCSVVQDDYVTFNKAHFISWTYSYCLFGTARSTTAL